MKVYVLMQGEQYEGGNVLGVFASPEAAKLHSDTLAHHCDWGPWSPDGYHGPGHLTSRTDDGCDWQQIEEFEVTE